VLPYVVSLSGNAFDQAVLFSTASVTGAQLSDQNTTRKFMAGREWVTAERRRCYTEKFKPRQRTEVHVEHRSLGVSLAAF
jgi:hypothetical protein